MINFVAAVQLVLSLSLPLVWSANTTHFCQRDYNIDTSDIANTPHVHLVRGTTIPAGTKYRYVFSPPGDASLPYLLFLHGYPESSYDWYYQISYFIGQGYGVIAPDLLGYGGTDNPSSMEAFNFRNMVNELGQLLDCEGVRTVIGISHDFGAPLLSRLINYQPQRLAAVAFLGNGYLPPQAQLDRNAISAFNNASLSRFGYAVFGYWAFNDNEDASGLLMGSLDSFYSLGWTRDSTYMRDHFAPYGAVREWLLHNRTATEVFTSRLHEENWKAITRAQGGFDGPLKWYRSMMRGYNNPDASDLNSSGLIQQPTLLVVAERDPISIPSLQLGDTLPFASNLRIRSVDSGHFIQIETPNEVNNHLDVFIKDVLSKSKLNTTSINVHYKDY